MWIISLWVLPIISACMWIATLVAMITTWAAQGKPHLPSMHEGQKIAFISDVGAQGLKPLFIAGSAVTMVFLDLAFLSERWLRHSGQLARNKGVWDKFCAVASIFFGIGGALGIILLATFDTVNHPMKHEGFLAMFLAGYLISAIFICLEYLRLGIFYRSQHRVLIAAFIIKLSFIIIEGALAIGFGVCAKALEGKRDTAAVLEWTIAFIFTGYILSFVVDLLPSVRTRRHVPQGEKHIELAQGRNDHASDVVIEEPLTMDSTGPSAGFYRGQRI